MVKGLGCEPGRVHERLIHVELRCKFGCESQLDAFYRAPFNTYLYFKSMFFDAMKQPESRIADSEITTCAKRETASSSDY